MTIEYVTGDLLSAPKGSVIVHGCNAQGVMGSGVALQIKEQFPQAFAMYMAHYNTLGSLRLGEITTVEVDERLIVNAITQEFYGRGRQRYVDYEAVACCFQAVVNTLENDFYFGMGYDTICFPKIGAGLANGDWDILSIIIDKTVPDKFRKVCYVL